MPWSYAAEADTGERQRTSGPLRQRPRSERANGCRSPRRQGGHRARDRVDARSRRAACGIFAFHPLLRNYRGFRSAGSAAHPAKDTRVNVLKLGLPKGSLEQTTIDLMKKSGWRVTTSSRSYFPNIDDPELACSLVRAQEMARYVELGSLDCGVTGKDWIAENSSDVEVICDLVYSKASFRPTRWVLAVPAESSIRRAEDLAGKRISTELVGFTRRYFAEKNVPVTVEFPWGATEAKVAAGLCDA